MYPNPITASNGTTSPEFGYRGPLGPNASEYREAAADLDQPHVITIKHTTSNAGKKTQLRRSVLRVDRTVEDATDGEQGVVSVYLVTVVPEKIATTAQVTAQVTLMKNILAVSGIIAKVVAAEV
jgi:hypothetical protein